MERIVLDDRAVQFGGHDEVVYHFRRGGEALAAYQQFDRLVRAKVPVPAAAGPDENVAVDFGVPDRNPVHRAGPASAHRDDQEAVADDSVQYRSPEDLTRHRVADALC